MKYKTTIITTVDDVMICQTEAIDSTEQAQADLKKHDLAIEQYEQMIENETEHNREAELSAKEDKELSL